MKTHFSHGRMRMGSVASAVAMALAVAQSAAFAASSEPPRSSTPAATTPAPAAAAPGMVSTPSTAGTTSTTAASATGRDARVSQLTGKDIRNAKNEDLGDIQDLVIDMDTGRVQYAVVSFGGVLGMGEKLFAYPLNAFRPAADKDELVLNVDQAQLKNAEGFEKNRWPNWNDPDWRGKVDRWSDKKAVITKTGRYKRASEIIGGDVKDPAGKDIGDIRELVVNLAGGNVRYAVVEFDRGWFKSDKYVAVPMQSLKRTGDKDDFVVSRTRAELETAPSFEKNKWPDINDPKYRSSVDSFNRVYPKP